MKKYFGTDGVRGVANQSLTPELAYRLGRCGGHVLAGEARNATFVVGRDTRISGPMLEAAVVAGLSSIGASVILLGVVTTPAVAYLSRHFGASGGVMISASHNPAEDNGIKLFDGAGFKLSEHVESEIERLMDAPEDRLPRPVGSGLRAVTGDDRAKDRYLHHLVDTTPLFLDGMRVVLDCAHGAAYEAAPRVLRALGANVTTIGAEPDGLNINDGCGATHLEALKGEVTRRGASLGLAFDGDADRLMAVDERGAEFDGDQILYACGAAMKRNGTLKKSTMVTTVMSNAGLAQAAGKLGITTNRTAVGDRHVTAEMRAGGYNLGGEPSGHIVFLDHGTTGDGILTALQLLAVLRRSGASLGELTRPMLKSPQVRTDVMVTDRSRLDSSEVIAATVRRVEREIGEEGHVLVRPSGTESLVRILVEGPDELRLKAYASEIAAVITRELHRG